MQLMNKNLWGIVKGTKVAPVDPNNLIEWKSRDDMEKSVNSLSLLDSELHQIYMDK
jgi:hypothetical protein